MKLISNWKTVAATAHSMWAFYLSVLCLVAPEIIYMVLSVDTNPRLWWFAGLFLLVYGIVGRLRDQGIDRDRFRSHWMFGLLVVLTVAAIATGDWRERLSGDPPASVEASIPTQIGLGGDPEFAELAVPFIGRWEGLRLEAYQDLAGVWTVCYGETRDVMPGDVYTKAECDAMFAHRVLDFRRRLHVHFTPETLSDRLPVARDVAFVSLAYNVGVAGAGGSTATRRLNAGDIAGACDALTWWNKAGGRVIRGLVNRRSEERDLCRQGLDA